MEKITRTCSHCGNPYRIGSELIGKKIRCPKCKAVELVSASEEAPPPKAAAPAPKPVSEVKAVKKAKKTSLFIDEQPPADAPAPAPKDTDITERRPRREKAPASEDADTKERRPRREKTISASVIWTSRSWSLRSPLA